MVIQVQNLRKSYATGFVAVDDISFEVAQGEIFGIIGPNGAGKTTTVETIIGLRQPDSGTIRVLQLNPQTERRALGERIGVQLQQSALPARIKVWEAMELFASFYAQPTDWKILLQEWGLADKRDTAFANLSGGQKQRLFIALALINRPEVVFLDELTTGLDPQARHTTWDLVRAIRERGTTVVLVTHFMDEAEQLCDRIALVDRGRLIALDTPQALIQQIHTDHCVRFSLPDSIDLQWLLQTEDVKKIVREHGEVAIYGGNNLLLQIATALAQRQLNPTNLRSEQANLEDVFLTLTGRAIRD